MTSNKTSKTTMLQELTRLQLTIADAKRAPLYNKAAKIESAVDNMLTIIGAMVRNMPDDQGVENGSHE